ncbi:TetR/AcrR family transcriptional regulator [Actinokineospora sp.]|uniref:TetR/AcrR family transcriptional regulator n=1 Tax=Actinokineospora sp. TaxID=1872133 RepID=UPI004037DE90
MPRTAGSAKPAITPERIVDAALAVIDADGFRALSMRTVAARLHTGPSSLYAHVRNKLELHQLVLTRLWSGLEVPRPDRRRWRRQLVQVYVRQAALFGRHPGLEGAYFGTAPTSPEFLAFVEGVSALYEAGGFRGERQRDIEATLEAMSVSWGLQQAALDHLTETSGRTDQQRYADIVASLREVDPERFPRVAATDLHSYPTREQRAAAFERRLDAVIRGFEANRK